MLFLGSSGSIYKTFSLEIIFIEILTKNRVGAEINYWRKTMATFFFFSCSLKNYTYNPKR